MFENLEVFRMAQGLAQNAAARQATIARNVAHADTPGYQSQSVESFAKTYSASDTSGNSAMRRSRDGHLHGASTQSVARSTVDRSSFSEPNGNSVSLETEIMKSAVARQQHDMALSIYKSGMNVLRASLGR